MRFFLILLLTLLPSFVAAQTASPPAATPRATPNPPAATNLTPKELALVRQAVSDVGSSYKRGRTADGVGNIVGGVLVGGIGMYLYLSQDDPNIRLIGVAIAFSAVPQLVAGMWNIFYHTAQEDMAEKLLSDDKLLDDGGLLFVEQEARRAKRNRLVGGSTSIVQGGATIASYFLLKEFFVTGPDNILLIFFAVGTAVQVIDGVDYACRQIGARTRLLRPAHAVGPRPRAPQQKTATRSHALASSRPCLPTRASSPRAWASASRSETRCESTRCRAAEPSLHRWCSSTEKRFSPSTLADPQVGQTFLATKRNIGRKRGHGYHARVHWIQGMRTSRCLHV